MPSKEKLEQLPLAGLAVLCKQVADNPKGYTEAGATEAEQADASMVQTPATASRPSLREQQEVERDQAELKKRMVEFLAGIL